MANFTFNIAKGRVNELVNRVDQNDPANSGLVIVLLQTAVSQSVMEDYETLQEVLAGASVEATATGYSRRIVTDSDPDIGFTVDHVNNRNHADLGDVSWTPLGNGNNTPIVSLIICYDPDTTSGDDSTIVPLTHNDFGITPDGSNITAQFAATGFYRSN